MQMQIQILMIDLGAPPQAWLGFFSGLSLAGSCPCATNKPPIHPSKIKQLIGVQFLGALLEVCCS